MFLQAFDGRLVLVYEAETLKIGANCKLAKADEKDACITMMYNPHTDIGLGYLGREIKELQAVTDCLQH